MENGEVYRGPIRFKFGEHGKLVRAGYLNDMINSGEQPDFVKLNDAELAGAIRDKLVEEFTELEAAANPKEMLDEAADFMSAAVAFHEHVVATPQDSSLFGDFQQLIRRLDLSMNDIEIRRRERDAEFGKLVVEGKVVSVLIGPDNPRRQYYLDNPDRFPRLG